MLKSNIFLAIFMVMIIAIGIVTKHYALFFIMALLPIINKANSKQRKNFYFNKQKRKEALFV